MKALIIFINIVVVAGASWWFLVMLFSGYGSPTGGGQASHLQWQITWAMAAVAFLSVFFSHVDHSKRALVWAAIPLLPILFYFGPSFFLELKNILHQPLQALGLDDRYDWNTGDVSAPGSYQVEVLRGEFIFKDGRSQHIPGGSWVGREWGNSGGSDISGCNLKPLPEKLSVTWYSLLEDKFYLGTFDLPYEAMARLYRETFDKPCSTMSNILVGLAPGGGVAVWLKRGYITTEVGFFQAKEVNIPWSKFSPEMKKEEYRKLWKKDLGKKELALLDQSKVVKDLFSTVYRARYEWEPTYVGQGHPATMQLTYFNGESEYLDYESGEKEAKKSRAVPKDFYLNWIETSGKRTFYEFHFGEDYIFDYFKKTNDSNPGTVRLEIKIGDQGTLEAVNVIGGNSKE